MFIDYAGQQCAADTSAPLRRVDEKHLQFLARDAGEAHRPTVHIRDEEPHMRKVLGGQAGFDFGPMIISKEVVRRIHCTTPDFHQTWILIGAQSVSDVQISHADQPTSGR